MARYIDMDKLLQDMCASHHLRIFSRNDADDMFEKMVGITQRQPTADVVEVVRCKDCKKAYINSFSSQSGLALCRFWTNRANEVICVCQDDFCSYGERSETNAE